jgi:hypothetical protein
MIFYESVISYFISSQIFPIFVSILFQNYLKINHLSSKLKYLIKTIQINSKNNELTYNLAIRVFKVIL